MSLKSKVKSGDVMDGLFPLEVIEINEDTKEYGPVLIFIFKVFKGDFAGRVVKGMATRHEPLSPRCKLYLWGRALAGRKFAENEEIDWGSMLGRQCLGEVKPHETDSGTFERVAKLMPLKLQ
jgi:hypothetical protein